MRVKGAIKPRPLHGLSTVAAQTEHGSDTVIVHGPSTGNPSADGAIIAAMNTNGESRPEHISTVLARALEAVRKAEG
jgi:hypothetical protein